MMAIVSGIGIAASVFSMCLALWNRDGGLALAWGSAAIWALACFLGDMA